MVSRQQRLERFEFLLHSPHRIDDPSTTRDSSTSLRSVDSTLDGGSQQGYENNWREQELRRLAQEGIPDEPPRIRPAAYRRLLNLDSPSSLSSQYSAFLSEVDSRITALPPPDHKEPLHRHDKLLREIERDVERTFGQMGWFGGKPDSERENGEDSLWRRIRMLDDSDRESANKLANPDSQDSSQNEQLHISKDSLNASEPTLTLDIPLEVDTTSTNIPPSTSPQSPATPRPASHFPDSSPSNYPSRPSTRRQSLLRPLFIYAFLNPGISYVQGMSYLAAVFAYVFASDSTLSSFEVESTTFFALGSLISQLQDLYVPTLDAFSQTRTRTLSNGLAAPIGLSATIARFEGLLTWLDPTVAEALDRKHIELGGIMLRWLTTLFANEFSFPDLIRIWDRIISLYPRSDHQAETLSPVLSHALDLALALVISNRATLISPYSNLQKIYTVLQSPSIEGAAVDELLLLAWNLRDRRSGRSSTKSSTPIKRSTIKSPSNTSVAGFAGLFKQKLWTPPSTPTAKATDFELDPTASSVSDARTGQPRDPSEGGGGRFGSIAFSSPRSSSGSLANNVTMIEGKLLPPPPARMAERETISSVVEAELASPEYGVEDEESTETDRRTSSLGGWFRNSVTRLAASDAAAQVMKAQTNLAVQAQLLKDRVAAEQLGTKVKEAGERLMASTGSERGYSESGDPRETPFTPPTGAGRIKGSSPFSSPSGHAANPSLSSAPRPLLLSSSARRAQNGSIDENSNSTLPSSSRSPSISPVLSRSTRLPLLSPDLSIPPLSRSPSRTSHGRSTSTLDTPSRVSTAANFRPRSASQSSGTALGSTSTDDDVPVTSNRIDETLRRSQRRQEVLQEGIGEEMQSSRLTQSGRGWQLSDTPVQADLVGATDPTGELELENGLSGLAIQVLPQSSDPSQSAAFDHASSSRTSHDNFPLPTSSPSSSTSFNSSFISPAPPTESAFVPPTESAFLPPAQSSESHHLSHPSEPSFESPSVVDDPIAELVNNSSKLSQPSLSRGARIARRPAATKKRSSRGSMAESLDLSSSITGSSRDERRIASEFLTRSTSRKTLGEEDGGSYSRVGVTSQGRASEGATRDSVYDETTFFDSYGEES